MKGLPLTLSDGQDYHFSPMRLGPNGDAVRSKIREYHSLLTKTSSIDIPDNAGLEDSLKIQKQYDDLEDQRLKTFISICVISLSENYPADKAQEIAENLVTPDLFSVILRIVRGGQYPETFTQPSSAKTRTA